MEVLPAGGGRTGRPQPEARPEDSGRGVPRAERARGSRDSWEGEEDPEPGEPRGSRTASLVSGLLTELYSCTEEEETVGGGRGPRGRQRRRDSLDSSTEASGSDVFLGGRGGAGDSRVLQELQERPSPRHQRQYLRQKGEGRGGWGCPGSVLVQSPLQICRRSPVRTCADGPSARRYYV